MIGEEQLYHLIFYEYGTPVFGSEKGMRYRVARNPLENVFFNKVADKNDNATLDATIWKGPYGYHATKEEKVTKSFPFSEEGKRELTDWLNEQYEAHKTEWAQEKLI